MTTADVAAKPKASADLLSRSLIFDPPVKLPRRHAHCARRRANLRPQIVIGTSLGGWLEILLALRRKERIAGLIGLAAAPDFTEDIYDHAFSDEQRREFDKAGIVHLRPSCGMDHIMTRKLFDEAKDHLLLNSEIELPFPVRLIHGKRDDHVPWQKSEKIMEQVVSPDIKVIWVEDGIHSMARD